MTIKMCSKVSIPIVKRFLGDNFWVAHAMYHVTLSPGSKITTRMKFLTPICLFTMPLLCVTMTIKRCSKVSIPIVERVLGVNFGVAHALYHVTLSPGSKITTRMKFSTPICLFTMR